MEEYRKHELHQQMLKEAELLREKERLINIEKRLQMAHADPLPKAVSPTKYSKRLYSFAEESPARKTDAVSREF